MKFLKTLLNGKRPSPTLPAPTEPWSLDTPLIYFSECPADKWTIRDACEGVQVFGGIGSGKTSGSGAAIARRFLQEGFGGLVMCAKPEEWTEVWEPLTLATGRRGDVIRFSPDESWRFNFLDYELRREGEGSGQTENLVVLMSKITEIVEGTQSMGGGDGQFFERAMRELLRNAIDLLSLANGTMNLQDIITLIGDAPMSSKQLADENWRRGSFCCQCMARARAKDKTPRLQHDYEMVERYWLKSYPNLADRTRSSIVATFTSIADVLLHGMAWELFCTETNIVPEVAYKNGAIIVLDIPIQTYDEVGRITQGIWKYMFQRAVLRRKTSTDPRPVFLWADESQNFISSFDYQYQAVARSARACTVYLSQNLSNYLAVLGSGAESEAHALLGNFQTKIFHANTDQATNQYASDVIAQHWATTQSFNTGMSEGGAMNMSNGGSESVQSKVLPAEFTILRKGGPMNNLEVEGIAFQGGRIWEATGDTYLFTTFKQGI